jgi:tetraacyldisaccharide 4'-kinase
VPVVVVGNLYVGGTGKDTIDDRAVRSLQQRAGIRRRVARLRRAQRRRRDWSTPASVDAAGDEPLLIARATQAPVSVGADRVAAAAALLAAVPGCDVIVADDGLQHLRLARDFEIAVVDERGLGNGWMLPAGPLREPARRLAAVDAIVAHNTDCAELPVGAAACYAMRTALADNAYALADRSRSLGLDELRERQRSGSIRITAAAGIGVP